MKEEEPRFIWSVVALLLILLYLLLFNSCKIVKEVPVETIKTEYRYIDRLQVDSLYQHDSIYIKAIGDTIYEYRDKYIYKYEFIRDTAYITKIDSIPYTIEIEKQLSKYEEMKMAVGGVGIPLVIILVCIGVGYVVKKFV